MQKVYGWEDAEKKQTSQFKLSNQKSRRLHKDKCSLTIAATGGCSKMAGGLSEVLKKNKLESPIGDNYFQSIVIITDRDETDTESSFIRNMEEVLKNENVTVNGGIKNNQWITCEMETQTGDRLQMRLLVMVIPFEENGAMETFLLDAIANQDAYDKNIIEECKKFIDSTDTERRYLKGRRLITKAKFDAFFCVRTAAEQFNQRRDIIKNIPWEEYTTIQKDFKLLEDITNKDIIDIV